MTMTANMFFQHTDAFFGYRKDIYEISNQTHKSNRVDLMLFENFIRSRGQKTIDASFGLECQSDCR